MYKKKICSSAHLFGLTFPIILLLSFFFLAPVLIVLKYEWLQVSVSLLSILTDFNNVMVCVFSILPPNSNSSSLFSKNLRTVPNTPQNYNAYHSFLDVLVFLLIYCVLGMTLNSVWCWVSSLGALGNWALFIAITPRLTLTGFGSIC